MTVGVTAVEGFVAAGAHAGIKDGAGPDLALVATADRAAVPAAAVFTTNHFPAAPVQVSSEHLAASGGRAAAVVLNSGNANAGTGEAGRLAAEQTCAAVAEQLGCDRREVLVCSTGLIGFPLATERLVAAVPGLVGALSPTGGRRAAEAILTTDTRRKEVAVDAGGFTVGGMAKGAAMLAPNMATMLAVLVTDAAAEPAELKAALLDGAAATFGALTIDGATSTNDTVIVLANGRAGRVEPARLTRAVHDACASLARQMAEDAEGATKVVRVRVKGAHSDEEAARAARAVAESQLVKCSWYGEDPYWGRVASELATAGVHLDPDALAIAYGGVVVADGGTAVDHDTQAVRRHMAGRELELTCDLGLGTGEAEMLTADLTHAYVDENMRTS